MKISKSYGDKPKLSPTELVRSLLPGTVFKSTASASIQMRTCEGYVVLLTGAVAKDPGTWQAPIQVLSNAELITHEED